MGGKHGRTHQKWPLLASELVPLPWKPARRLSERLLRVEKLTLRCSEQEALVSQPAMLAPEPVLRVSEWSLLLSERWMWQQQRRFREQQ